jgi:hypothetical protein
MVSIKEKDARVNIGNVLSSEQIEKLDKIVSTNMNHMEEEIDKILDDGGLYPLEYSSVNASLILGIKEEALQHLESLKEEDPENSGSTDEAIINFKKYVH